MRRRAGVEERKAAVKQLREARRQAAQSSRMVRGPGGPRLLRQPQPAAKPRKVSFASMRDRVLADGSVVIGPDGEKKPLLAEAIAADRSNGSPIVERLPDKPIFDARGTRTGRFIKGRDYPAKPGDEVHAVADGVVDEVGKPDA